MSGYHAKLSPSGAHRWMRCPGSVALEEQYPADKAGAHAAEGTLAHTLASDCLDGTGEHPFQRIGETHEVGGFTFTVDKIMADYVDDYIRLVRDYAKRGMLLVERRVPIGHMTGEEGATGTSDAIVVDSTNRTLFVIDLKFGMGVRVDATRNEQLMMYALGALEMCEHLCDFDEVCMVIHQPRLNHVAEEWISVADLLSFRDEVSVGAERVRDATAKRAFGGTIATEIWPAKFLSPGERQCKWCKAKHNCPAVKALVDETVDHIAPAASADDFADLGDNSLSIAMGRVDLIEQWCRAVRAEVERRLVAGTDVPGYKLVEGRRGNRAWKSTEIAQEELAKFLKRDEMYEEKFISPATAEKLLKKNPDGLEALDSLTERPEGKLSVAPATDKRPAKAATATADDFADR
jgi:hypothetical protein